MEGVVGVVMDQEQPRESVCAVERDGRLVLRASGFPRSIPGVPPERTLQGISFAVANATGVLAALLAGAPEVRTAAEALALVGSE
jgi:hypothetical protein